MNIPLDEILFTKMHGLGNDFLMIDCLDGSMPPEELMPALTKRACARHFGVGGDGIILIMQDDEGDADYRMRMWNPDGSESEMCGNGIRCFAKYLYDKGLIEARPISVATTVGLQHIEVVGGQSRNASSLQVRVDMGVPKLLRSQIPMMLHEGNGGDGRVVDYPLDVAGETFHITAVSMGNPHVVIFVDDVESVALKEIGLEIEHHHDFPQRTNVHFVQMMGRASCGCATGNAARATPLACGTGACASVVAASLNGVLPDGDRHAMTHLPGGDLNIEWAGNDRIYMTGPAKTVFSGQAGQRVLEEPGLSSGLRNSVEMR